MNVSLMFVFSSKFEFETGLLCNNPFCWAKLLDRSTWGIILHYCYFLTRHLSQICAQRWEGENGQDGHSHLFFSPSFLWSLILTHKLFAFHTCLCLQPNCKKQRGGRCNWLVVASPRGGGVLRLMLGMCCWPLRAPIPLWSILWPTIDPILVTFWKM